MEVKTIRLEEKTWRRLDMICKVNNCTKNTAIKWFVDEYFKKAPLFEMLEKCEYTKEDKATTIRIDKNRIFNYDVEASDLK